MLVHPLVILILILSLSFSPLVSSFVEIPLSVDSAPLSPLSSSDASIMSLDSDGDGLLSRDELSNPTFSGAVTALQGCPQLTFTASVSVGGQPFRLIIDTGSTTIAVASQSCRECDVSPLFQPSQTDLIRTSSPIASTYGDASGWSGSAYKSQVRVGSSSSVRMIMASIDSSQKFFHRSICRGQTASAVGRHHQGILGLAFQPVAISITQSWWDIYSSYLNGLKTKNPAIAAKRPAQFSIQMCLSGGALWLEGYHPSSINGPIVWTEVTEKKYWSVKWRSIAVGNQILPLKAQDLGETIVDSGSTAMVLNRETFNAVVSALNADPAWVEHFGDARAFMLGGQCTTPKIKKSTAELNSLLPKLALLIGERSPVQLVLNAVSGYLLLYQSSPGLSLYCPGLSIAPSSHKFSILGYTAMNQFTTIFDSSVSNSVFPNGRIGFGAANYVSCPSEADSLPAPTPLLSPFSWRPGKWAQCSCNDGEEIGKTTRTAACFDSRSKSNSAPENCVDSAISRPKIRARCKCPASRQMPAPSPIRSQPALSQPEEKQFNQDYTPVQPSPVPQSPKIEVFNRPESQPSETQIPPSSRQSDRSGDEEFDVCRLMNCGVNGRCVPSSGSEPRRPVCICRFGWTGATCELPAYSQRQRQPYPPIQASWSKPVHPAHSQSLVSSPLPDSSDSTSKLIIPIAVCCSIIALIVAAVLIWYFCFRQAESASSFCSVSGPFKARSGGLDTDPAFLAQESPIANPHSPVSVWFSANSVQSITSKSRPRKSGSGSSTPHKIGKSPSNCASAGKSKIESKPTLVPVAPPEYQPFDVQKELAKLNNTFAAPVPTPAPAPSATFANPPAAPSLFRPLVTSSPVRPSASVPRRPELPTQMFAHHRLSLAPPVQPYAGRNSFAATLPPYRQAPPRSGSLNYAFPGQRPVTNNMRPIAQNLRK